MDLTGKNILVFDIETQKSFQEVGGKSRANFLEKLKVSVVGTYDYLTDKYYAYEESEMMVLEQRLRSLGLIVGFNSRRFDLPVLQPYLFMKGEDIPQIDLLEAIEEARGHRASLDSVAGPTLKLHKSGSGKDALVLFKEGKMDELKHYCLDDVKLTRLIFEYGLREDKILFTSTWDYKTYEVPVNWRKQVQDIFSVPKTAPQEKFPSSLF
ncbi:MAG: ribonuclease H-like domain-containing protein [Candidatus Omnitrophica bacterium]|nr:ribonuclease H-like domain-containing protein [Candidatus Omnitrophota bacterium]